MDGDAYDDLIVLDSYKIRRFPGGAKGLASSDDWSHRVADPKGVYLSDFDGDGLLDVVYALRGSSRQLHVVYGDRSRSSGLAATAKVVDVSPAIEPWRGGDINGDGRDDYIAQGTVILAGSTPTVVAQTGRAHHNLDSGDFDGDGYADLVAWREGGSGSCWQDLEVRVYPGGPTGPGSPKTLWSTPCVVLDSDTQLTDSIEAMAAIGDVNGDGYGDGYGDAAFIEARWRVHCPHWPTGCTVTMAEGPYLGVRLGSASGLDPTPVYRGTLVGPATITVTAVGDTDCDGYDEFVVREDSRNVCSLYHGASGGVGRVQELTGVGRWRCFGVGDVDGSGSIEVGALYQDGRTGAFSMGVHHGTGSCPPDADGDGIPHGPTSPAAPLPQHPDRTRNPVRPVITVATRILIQVLLVGVVLSQV